MNKKFDGKVNNVRINDEVNFEEFTVAQWLPPKVIKALKKGKGHVHLITVKFKNGERSYYVNGKEIK